MHVNWDPQHRGQGDEICTEVSVAGGSVVGTPVDHPVVDRTESTLTGDSRHEERRRPGRIGTFLDLVLYLVGKADGPALSNLQDWALTRDEVEARSG